MKEFVLICCYKKIEDSTVSQHQCFRNLRQQCTKVANSGIFYSTGITVLVKTSQIWDGDMKGAFLYKAHGIMVQNTQMAINHQIGRQDKQDNLALFQKYLSVPIKRLYGWFQVLSDISLNYITKTVQV